MSERARRWQQLGKAAAGFAIGLAVWLALTPAYNRAVAFGARGVLALIQSEPAPEFRSKGREVLVIRSDVPPGSSRPGIPLYDLTFNIVLLTTLFAVNTRPFGDHNVKTFLLAAAILFLSHVLGLTFWTKDLYASWFGSLSQKEYGETSRLLWSRAVLFYRIIGQFAIPVLLWWLLRVETSDAVPARDSRRKRSKGR